MGRDTGCRVPKCLMTDKTIKKSFDRDGYVVVKNLIDPADLDPIRDFIASKVDSFVRKQLAEGKLSSAYEEESFGRRYAAVCEALDISPRDWSFGSFGEEFYDLYTLPGILHVLSVILGPEVSNLGSPALRTKLPNSVITSFPWHQDSQYVDQPKAGIKEQHTGDLPMVTVWVPLVEATVENGCCWVIPGSHRWGLLEGARGEDRNVRIEEDVETRGNTLPIPLEPGGALFMSNLCVHTSKVNQTLECRWSIDYRYFPTPDRADLSPAQRTAAEFVQSTILRGKSAPLVVLPDSQKPTWHKWEAQVLKQRSGLEKG